MLNYEKKRGVLTVKLSGELDHSSAPTVRRELDDLLADTEVRRLILDTRALTFMDSSGIGVIMGRYRLLSRRGGSVAVMANNPHVDRIFQLSGLYQIVEKLA